MNTTNGVNATASPIVPARLAVPPPRLVFDLTDMDRRVGWVRGDVIGFRGFGSHVEAAHAAWAAHRAIVRRLDRRTGGGGTALIDREPLALARRGDRELVLAGGRPIATLLRPGSGSPSDPDTFGFEIQLGAPSNELTMRAAANVTYRALRRSGLPWAMWTRDAHREPSRSAEYEPQRESRTAAAVSAPEPRRFASFVRMLLRMTTVALLFALVALAARPFGATRPITVPVGVIALAGLGAAAVSEANRRWQPQRMQPANRAPVADRPDDVITSPRRAV